MAQQGATLELYRGTVIGDCLVEALEALNEEGKVSEEMALAILKQFDKSFLEAMQHVTARATIKADLKTYRYYDNIWQFSLENVVVRLTQAGGGAAGNCELVCERAKVICADCKLFEPPPAPPAPKPEPAAAG